MNKLKYYLVGWVLMIGALTLNTTDIQAQCPMCKMSAESNLNEGGSAGKGLNKGIFVLLATPYVVVGAIGFVWYRNRKRKRLEEAS